MDVYQGLYDFQHAGVEFLSERRTAFLADDMGIGKSAQAIRAADRVGARRILVVCPAIARRNWLREFQKWGLIKRRGAIALSGMTTQYDYNILVVSFDGAKSKQIYMKLIKLQFDLLIIDEAHYLKNRSAKRTIAVYGRKTDMKAGLSSRCKRVWALSGTPMPNNPAELWVHLFALFPESIPTLKADRPMWFVEFRDTFCRVVETDYGPKIIGARNTDKLKAILKPNFLRRRKSQVLKDLPPARWVPVVLEPEDAMLSIKALEDNEHIKLATDALQLLLKAKEDTTPTAEEDAAEGALREAGKDPIMSTLRRHIGLAKIGPVVSYIRETLESGGIDKVLIFAQHVDVVKGIARGLSGFGSVCVYGGTPPAARNRAEDQFQTNPAVRVWVGQIDTCATALTLTAASDVFFAEMSWVPVNNNQAADRAHRIGQKNSVLVRCFSLAGSIDEAVNEVIRRKSRTIAEILN